MKVVLLKDVPKVGRKHDVKEVSSGYGRNFLLLNGLAVLATEKSLKTAEEFKQKIVAVKNQEESMVIRGLVKLAGVRLLMKRKTNEEGVLFASIKTEELSAAVKDQAGLIVSSEYIKLEKPIKAVGEYEIEVVVVGKKGGFKLVVEKE